MARRRIALLGVPRSAGEASSDLEARFIARCRELDAPSVLELGTKQSVPGRSTMHRDWVPHAAEFLGTDFEDGADVDILADVHRLSRVVGEERFDIILSCSTFEHLKYPTVAAHEVMKALKVGGLLYIQTHQSFPLHGYPSDYFRFSREALASLFGTTMGLEIVATNNDFPAQIYSRRLDDSHRFLAFLNTTLGAEAGADAGRVPIRPLGRAGKSRLAARGRPQLGGPIADDPKHTHAQVCPLLGSSTEINPKAEPRHPRSRAQLVGQSPRAGRGGRRQEVAIGEEQHPPRGPETRARRPSSNAQDVVTDLRLLENTRTARG